MGDVAKFLGVTCEYDAKTIAEECNFSKMKAKGNAHGFKSVLKPADVKYFGEEATGNKEKPSNAHIRKGIVGDWENYYTKEQLKQWEDYVNQACEKYPRVLAY